MADLSETVKSVHAAIMQIQDGLHEINTHIEAAMFSYHVAHDLERGRKHLTADVKRSICRIEQGIFTVKHKFERVAERARTLEREQKDRKDEEELLEAVEEVESPRKKQKVDDAAEGDRHSTAPSPKGEIYAEVSTQQLEDSMAKGGVDEKAGKGAES
eukprot:Seg2067.2 transcript_id=Seg2067.2/GoldUCD/mRNA.D3Y31 product="hypothetical protein" protein_id=Seg2067.2/GoldUCD/D3Y31